jgi:predicted TIM-barrel fold metal-dependent hydrolase
MSAGEIIDVHTHAFPDFLAPHAISRLEERAAIRARLDGTAAGLLASMDRAGIRRSVVCSIATEPRQFKAIMQWSREIASERLLPFPSVHPSSGAAAEEVRRVAAAGFRGIKLHPEYQDFHADDPGLAAFYGEIERARLVVLFHAGHDIGFPDSERSAPRRILAVARAYPGLRVVASHLGGFRRWEEVAGHLLGSELYLDTSYAIGHVPAELFATILNGHRPDRILFGSDSPWVDQAEAVGQIRALRLGPARETAILGGNARALLGLPEG